jgi:hypothetical protein
MLPRVNGVVTPSVNDSPGASPGAVGASQEARLRRIRTALVVALAAAVVGGSALVARYSNRQNAPLSVDGVFLGLAPRDVRARFALPGTWRANPSSDDYALEWAASAPSEPARTARFEFHLGALVAIRARLSPRDDAARGSPLEATASVLLARSPASDGDVDVLLVARDCPTHAAEVSALLKGRSPRKTSQ